MLNSAPGEMVVTAGTLAPMPPIPPEEITGPGITIEKLAGAPSAVALTVTGPLAGPMVTDALAIPMLSVRTCAGAARFAEPCTTAKLTSAPARAFPELSVTRTVSGAGAGCLVATVWPSPLMIATLAPLTGLISYDLRKAHEVFRPE